MYVPGRSGGGDPTKEDEADDARFAGERERLRVHVGQRDGGRLGAGEEKGVVLG